MRRRREPESRYAQDNRVAPNPWAFVTVGLAAGALVGLAVLFWLL
jgi:ElaB/YqjD/DUF883 family membrane-anchored ribosome-binding protein